MVVAVGGDPGSGVSEGVQDNKRSNLLYNMSDYINIIYYWLYLCCFGLETHHSSLS